MHQPVIFDYILFLFDTKSESLQQHINPLHEVPTKQSTEATMFMYIL